MTLAPRLAEVRAGRARDFARPAWDHAPDRIWRSAYDKAPISGPAFVRRLGVEGDEQYEVEVHGGPEMALLAYSIERYPEWREWLSLPEIGPGGFGENLCVSGLDETSVCIGDVWRVGEARLQISQPRGPCANISRRWDRMEMLRRVTETARAGWYLRVLEEGRIAAGDAIERLERPCPEWTIERVFRARVEHGTSAETFETLAALEELSPEWRAKFAARLEALRGA